MAMVEVDPKLFIKCRLCLEDSGIYQIVPSVREQISYCFDINVKPFDGLPQLICKKCQSIICDYSKTKRSYIEKQDKLKKRSQIPQETEPCDPAMAVKQGNSVNVNKRRRIRILSTSSNKSDCKSESLNQMITDSAIIDETKTQGWMKDYTKTFSCKFCDSRWTKRKMAKTHKAEMHRNFEIKHADVLSKNCIVKLPRIDSKPNITGSTEQVVYSKERIIAMGDIDFNISYTYTGKLSNSDSENEGSSSMSSTINAANVRRAVIVRRRPRRRICSRSSNETVVLENNSPSLEVCINIDDSDSDDETKKRIRKSDECTAKMNAIAKLITIAHNKYLKRHEKPEKPPIEKLNRKIISIGRQIINKRGFDTSRLMKYMEHMNLDIIWLSRSPLNVTSNSNYFKIIPRSRYSTEKNIKHFEGYKKKYDKPKENKRKEVQATETTEVSRKDPESRLAMLTTDAENTRNLGLEPGLNSENGTGPEIAQDFNAPLPDMRKLLNANPVANPKQLPKKFNSDAKKDKAQYAASMPTLENLFNTKNVSEATFSGREANIQMPIIAFTTSLAVPQAKITPINNQPAEILTTSLNSNCEKPIGPRIKVKSVTELMSKETLKRMHKPDAPVTQNQETYNGAAFSGVTSTMSTINNARSISPTVYNCEDFVILDTIELPNTKTSAPFQYFRTLLQVYNLILLDTDATLTGDFNTLIKFKVLYNQEIKDQPVILCLSLFCTGNTFCLKIKDRNEDNINMAKISANWQWEILKIYRGDVVVKLLTNAKKISQEMYDYTNRFLCLLKSINFVPK